MRVPVLGLGLFVVGGVGAIVAVKPNAAVLFVIVDVVAVYPTFFKQFVIFRIVHVVLLASPSSMKARRLSHIVFRNMRSWTSVDIQDRAWGKTDSAYDEEVT
jgi:hypothetical protein